MKEIHIDASGGWLRQSSHVMRRKGNTSMSFWSLSNWFYWHELKRFLLQQKNIENSEYDEEQARVRKFLLLFFYLFTSSWHVSELHFFWDIYKTSFTVGFFFVLIAREPLRVWMLYTTHLWLSMLYIYYGNSWCTFALNYQKCRLYNK